jgi:hypothetical protein
VDNLRLRALLFLQLALLACNNDENSYSIPRLLDQCLWTPCSTTGTAIQTKGFTDDSVAFEVLPGEATIDMPFDFPSGNTKEILVAGEGILTVDLGKADSGSSSSEYALLPEGLWIPISNVRPLRLHLSGTQSASVLDIRVKQTPEGCM